MNGVARKDRMRNKYMKEDVQLSSIGGKEKKTRDIAEMVCIKRHRRYIKYDIRKG